MEPQPQEETPKEQPINNQPALPSEADSCDSVVCIYDNQVKDKEVRVEKSLSKEFAKQLSDKIEMSFSMQASGLMTKYPNKTDAAMDRIEMVDKFVHLAEVGSQTALEDMAKMLSEDPKRFLYERNDPQHLINELNSSSYNAAYAAAKNGNLTVLKFLFQNKAELKLTSVIKHKFMEQPIEVAARWQHHETVLWMI